MLPRTDGGKMADKGKRLFSQTLFAATGVLFVWLVLGVSSTLRAQSTAVLKGTVSDPSGAVVPKAKVLARNEGTGVQTETQTDDAGEYVVAGLPVGDYRVEVSAPGFQTTVVSGLRLGVSATVVQDVKLEVGATTQEVTISEPPPLLEASTMTVGQTIMQRTVQEMPLNGRHFVDLTLLSPGTVTPPQNGFLTAPLRGQGSFGVNTAGLREDMVNYMINGINLSDQLQNQITFQPSINTVQEFKVDNSTFSAEYGRNAGAIINIATRSGTNNFHGELFELLRNEKLDATNFFTRAPATKPPFKRNNFGADVGGPLKKDKAFFFASYEGLRQHQGIVLATDVPSDAQRAAVTDPVVRKLLPLIQHANGVDPAGNPAFNGAVSAPVQIDQGTGDLQFNLARNDQLRGYVAIQEDTRQEPTLSGHTLPGWGDTRHARRQIVTVNEVHIFGSSVTNEARAGYNRIHILFTPNQLLNPGDFGIANGINAPIGLPQIIIGANLVPGLLNIGGETNLPQGRGDTTGVFNDTVHWLRGRHSFAFGGEVRRFFNNNILQNDGSYTFADLAHFLADQANRFNVTIGSANDKIVQGAWGLFAQDSFRWTPTFTLELGLRYDYNASPTELHNLFAPFVPATDSIVQVGTNGLNQVYRTNNKNVQPRLGLAWDPFKNGTTVVRAAYAILTDQPVTNAVNALSGNPPFALPVTISSNTNAITFLNTGSASATSIAPATINPDFQNAYVQSWNLNIQHEVTASLGVMVGYFGSKGTHLRVLRNINQPGSTGQPLVALSASSPIFPGKLLGSNIGEQDSGSNSNYNALWLTVRKRLSRNFQFDTSYTYSKSLDDNSLTSVNTTGLQDSFNVRGDYGPSDFDARHRVVVSGLYDLPFKGHRVSEGWELGLIFQAQSGNPLTLVTNNSGFTGNQTLRPDVVGPVVTTGNPDQWFANPAVFVFPSTGGKIHFGNLSRNAVTGPDFINADFNLLKTTKITESTSLQFRAEAFDVLNHANFGNPGRVLGTSGFGVVSNTRAPTGDFGSSRQIQFGLKLLF
jgi:Carboxypeptidase regulatory-like domain/TonB dependent receptor